MFYKIWEFRKKINKIFPHRTYRFAIKHQFSWLTETRNSWWTHFICLSKDWFSKTIHQLGKIPVRYMHELYSHHLHWKTIHYMFQLYQFQDLRSKIIFILIFLIEIKINWLNIFNGTILMELKYQDLHWALVKTYLQTTWLLLKYIYRHYNFFCEPVPFQID